MDFKQLIDGLDPSIYESLKRALELGRWPDGRALSAEQKEHCMRAVIAYDLQHKAEADRVGYIDRGSKAEGELCGDGPGHSHSDAEDVIKWTH